MNKSIIFPIAFLYISFAVSASPDCETSHTPINSHFDPTLVKLERNPGMASVTGNYVVTLEPSITGRLTSPKAVSIATSLAKTVLRGRASDGHLIEVMILGKQAQFSARPVSPSGEVFRRVGNGLIYDVDAVDPTVHRIYISQEHFSNEFDLLSTGFLESLSPTPQRIAAASGDLRSLPLRVDGISPSAKLYVAGLISISAEPPEAFFAASTAAELNGLGWDLGSASEAGIWIVRTADSRKQSYFEFLFPTEDRPVDSPRTGKFLVATGLGTANEPGSPGGSEASLLWLGDESAGTLSRYLRTIANPGLTWASILGWRGLVQAVNSRQVLVAGIDRSYGLTPKGFNSLVTDPKLYRKIINPDYDRYLSSLFEYKAVGSPGATSYLLATSRGCSQGCSLCCSGGLKSFQFFSAQRILEELGKIWEDSGLLEGSTIDLYFVDSNFNNNPKRIIDFAQLYNASPLAGRFNFYIRHNTLSGFLHPQVDGRREPNVELIRAYKALGIREIFMGIDSFDDASTLTLKTNRLTLAKKGTETRPIYTFAEIERLVLAIDEQGLFSKGFYLTNNPWVSDLDRIDSYFNLFSLWLNSERFSIDSRKGVLSLKPFEGSPIELVTRQMDRPPVAGNRYRAVESLGEIDEMINFEFLGLARHRGGQERVLEAFSEGIKSIFLKAESEGSAASIQIMRKILDRMAEFLPFLAENYSSSPAARDLALVVNTWRSRHPDLQPVLAEEQRARLDDAARPLVEGLAALGSVQGRTRPLVVSGLRVRRGYLPEVDQMDLSGDHTIKDVSGYIADNLGDRVLAEIKSGRPRFMIAIGDGQSSLQALSQSGWRIGEIVDKREGYHYVIEAWNPSGQKTYVINRVNGEDRVIHLQSLLKLAGVPSAFVERFGSTFSWKKRFLDTFKSLGHVPDLVIYGFANTSVDTFLLQNKFLNDQHFDYLTQVYEGKHRPRSLDAHDFDGNAMQIIELQNGKKIWFFNCFYGDLSRDLGEALTEHGARNILFLGTAGALDSRYAVGDMITPAQTFGHGNSTPISVLAAIPSVPQRGTYQRVSTPNLETTAWLQRSLRLGVEVIEVELEYWIELARQNPALRLQAALVISDVLSGVNHQDMTEWGIANTEDMRMRLRTMFYDLTGARGNQDFLVDRYFAVPLVAGARIFRE